jgi:hypothetical protein
MAASILSDSAIVKMPSQFKRGEKKMLIRARYLKPGHVMVFATKGDRIVAEVKPDVVESQYPPHRPYKVVRVRWQGETDFNWKTSASGWVSVKAGRRHYMIDTASRPVTWA